MRKTLIAAGLSIIIGGLEIWLRMPRNQAMISPQSAGGTELFKNPGFGNHWIRIKLVGKQSNHSAIATPSRLIIIEKWRSSLYLQIS